MPCHQAWIFFWLAITFEPSVSWHWDSLHGMKVFLLLFIVHPSPFFISTEVQWNISHDCKNLNNQVKLFFFHCTYFLSFLFWLKDIKTRFFFLIIGGRRRDSNWFRNQINFHWHHPFFPKRHIKNISALKKGKKN